MDKIITLTGAFFLLIPIHLLAHEGHGHSDAASPLHYIAEPLHVMLLLAAAGIIGGLVYRYIKQVKKS